MNKRSNFQSDLLFFSSEQELEHVLLNIKLMATKTLHLFFFPEKTLLVYYQLIKKKIGKSKYRATTREVSSMTEDDRVQLYASLQYSAPP